MALLLANSREFIVDKVTPCLDKPPNVWVIWRPAVLNNATYLKYKAEVQNTVFSFHDEKKRQHFHEVVFKKTCERPREVLKHLILDEQVRRDLEPFLLEEARRDALEKAKEQKDKADSEARAARVASFSAAREKSLAKEDIAVASTEGWKAKLRSARGEESFAASTSAAVTNAALGMASRCRTRSSRAVVAELVNSTTVSN